MTLRGNMRQTERFPKDLYLVGGRSDLDKKILDTPLLQPLHQAQTHLTRLKHVAGRARGRLNESTCLELNISSSLEIRTCLPACLPSAEICSVYPTITARCGSLDINHFATQNKKSESVQGPSRGNVSWHNEVHTCSRAVVRLAYGGIPT